MKQKEQEKEFKVSQRGR